MYYKIDDDDDDDEVVLVVIIIIQMGSVKYKKIIPF